jgi:hypothetical protein
VSSLSFFDILNEALELPVVYVPWGPWHLLFVSCSLSISISFTLSPLVRILQVRAGVSGRPQFSFHLDRICPSGRVDCPQK